MKKALLMAVAMFLPISIFLFLKFFGKNEFVVEPLFQQRDTTLVINCNKVIAYPFAIDKKTLDTLADSTSSLLSVFSFTADADRLKDFADRLYEKNSNQEIDLFWISSDSSVSIKEGKFKTKRIEKKIADEIQSCVFLLSGLNNAVLVNQEGKIMGQYQLGNLDEEDRLLVETTIILKKY